MIVYDIALSLGSSPMDSWSPPNIPNHGVPGSKKKRTKRKGPHNWSRFWIVHMILIAGPVHRCARPELRNMRVDDPYVVQKIGRSKRVSIQGTWVIDYYDWERRTHVTEWYNARYVAVSGGTKNKMNSINRGRIESMYQFVYLLDSKSTSNR